MAARTPATPLGRGISEAEVEATLANPDVTYTDPTGKPTMIRHIGGRRIKVVMRPGTDPLFIITVAD